MIQSNSTVKTVFVEAQASPGKPRLLAGTRCGPFGAPTRCGMRLDCSCGRPTCRRPSTKPGCYQIRPVAAATSGGEVLFSPTLAEQWCTGLPWLNRTWPNSNYSDTNELTSWTWLTLMSLNTASGPACVCVWVRVGLCVFRRRRRKRNFPSFRYGNLKIFDKREAARTVEWGGTPRVPRDENKCCCRTIPNEIITCAP